MAFMPLSVRLIGKSSLPGAALVLGIALFFVLAVPGIARWAQDLDQAGQTVPVGNDVRITVADGWSVEDQSHLGTVLVSGSSNLFVEPGEPATTSLDDAIAQVIAALEADETTTWVVAEPVAFTTDAGDTGISVAASSETAATQVWIIDHSHLRTSATLNGTLESWTTAQPAALEMVESIEFSEDEHAS